MASADLWERRKQQRRLRQRRRAQRDEMKKRKAIGFDITELLTAAGDNGATLPALTILARDISGNLSLSEDDVRAELNALLRRGLVKAVEGRWKMR